MAFATTKHNAPGNNPPLRPALTVVKKTFRIFGRVGWPSNHENSDISNGPSRSPGFFLARGIALPGKLPGEGNGPQLLAQHCRSLVRGRAAFGLRGSW